MEQEEKDFVEAHVSPPLAMQMTELGTGKIPELNEDRLASPTLIAASTIENCELLDAAMLETDTAVIENDTAVSTVNGANMTASEQKQEISSVLMREPREQPEEERSCPSYQFQETNREISLQSISIQTSLDAELWPQAFQPEAEASESFESASVRTHSALAVVVTSYVSKHTETDVIDGVLLNQEKYDQMVQDITQKAMATLRSELAENEPICRPVATEDITDNQYVSFSEEEGELALPDENTYDAVCIGEEAQVSEHIGDRVDQATQTSPVIIVQPPHIARCLRSTSVCGFLGIVATGVSGILGLWAGK